MNRIRRLLTLLTLSHFMYGNEKYENFFSLCDWLNAKHCDDEKGE